MTRVDSLIYYYGCSSFGKNRARGVRVLGGGIFHARLRPEGYVSVDAGSLITLPLRVPAGDLYVESSGPVRIAVLDDAGHELGASELHGDSLSHRILLHGTELKLLADQDIVRLSFSVRPGGRLYAFVVR